MRERDRESETAVWEECPRCLIPFELDVGNDDAYYLVCPCCGMRRMTA